MTIETTSAAAAGWYADPAGSTALRWWDGIQWTNHLQQGVVQQPVAQQAVVQQPVAQQAPLPVAAPEVDLSGYRPGEGFGGIPRGGTFSQAGYNTGGFGGSPYVPIARINNSIAWFAFVAGIVAIGAIAIRIAAPTASFYLPVFGLTAIVSSIRAIARSRRGTVTVVWAPIVGLVLGSIAEIILIAVLILGAMVQSGAIKPGTVDPNSGSSSSTGSTGSTGGTKIGPPTGTGINYSMGHGSIQYQPASATLSAAADAEAQLVAALKEQYPQQNWPQSLEPGPDGEVVASDGHDVGTFLQSGWYIDYRVLDGGDFLLEITAQQTDEVAVYYSDVDGYWAWCNQSDATCKTRSPVAPTTSSDPADTSGATA